MNPAILVILWIRLNVIFGYPVPLAGPYNPLMVPRAASEFEDYENVTEVRNLNRLVDQTATFFHMTETSPYFKYEKTQPTSTATIPNETRIISIVRVSSTSVVVQPKRSERVTKSVNSNSSHTYNSFTGRNIASGSPYENVATPLVSLLRNNRFDVDENGPKMLKTGSSSISTRSKTPFHTPRYFDNYSVVANTLYRRYNTLNETAETGATSTANGTDTAPITETYPTSIRQKTGGEFDSYHGHHNYTEKVCRESEKLYEEAETERSYTELDKYKAEQEEEPRQFDLPGMVDNSNPYSFRTRMNDKKSSFIIDNGTHRKYRVEEKTSEGFIVGEYGMVSHRDGSLRGVRYTADGNISRGTISRLLMHFLSLK